MTEKLWIKLSGVMLITLYPILIYFGLKFLDPRWVSFMMIVLIGLRLLVHKLPPRTGIALVFALFVATGFTLLTGSEYGLLYYPVLMNAVLFILFIYSWFRPPTVIETIARIQEPELPPAGVIYTRKVTLVWSVFFIINGCCAAISTTLSNEYWALYNGFIAYILMGVLFVGEWLVRRRVKRQHRA